MANDSPPNETPEQSKPAMLVIAHPGHELRVHRWVETTSPEVWILTDGSGRSRRSRTDSTTRVLEAAGGLPGPVYGCMTDADLYGAVLNFDYQPFKDLVDRLAAALIGSQVNCIAGDAEEGYNPAHDICRLVINAAVRLVKIHEKRQIANYDFTLVGSPDRCPEELRADSLWINLDDAAFLRKISAARNYPELQSEVEAALDGIVHESLKDKSDLIGSKRSRFGTSRENNFRIECLRPVRSQGASIALSNGRIPFYEEYGEKQVKAGHYSEVLRYREHIKPLAAALDAHVRGTVDGRA